MEWDGTAWDEVEFLSMVLQREEFDSALTMEPHDILIILLVVDNLGSLDNLSVGDIRPRLRREDMAHSLPRDKITATVAVDTDETRERQLSVPGFTNT